MEAKKRCLIKKKTVTEWGNMNTVENARYKVSNLKGSDKEVTQDQGIRKKITTGAL